MAQLLSLDGTMDSEHRRCSSVGALICIAEIIAVGTVRLAFPIYSVGSCFTIFLALSELAVSSPPPPMST